MVHGGWRMPDVLGGTSVPLCGERGGCPHIGTFAQFARGLCKGKKRAPPHKIDEFARYAEPRHDDQRLARSFDAARLGARCGLYDHHPLDRAVSQAGARGGVIDGGWRFCGPSKASAELACGQRGLGGANANL